MRIAYFSQRFQVSPKKSTKTIFVFSFPRNNPGPCGGPKGFGWTCCTHDESSQLNILVVDFYDFCCWKFPNFLFSKRGVRLLGFIVDLKYGRSVLCAVLFPRFAEAERSNYFEEFDTRSPARKTWTNWADFKIFCSNFAFWKYNFSLKSQYFFDRDISLTRYDYVASKKNKPPHHIEEKSQSFCLWRNKEIFQNLKFEQNILKSAK